MEDERNLDLEALVDPPPPPGFEESPKKAPGRPRWVSLALIAGACALLVGLGIWIGAGFGSSKTTQPPESEQLQSPPETTAPSEPGWEANLLRADPVPYQSKYAIDWDDEAEVFPVFGSEYRREQIASVTFLDTLSDAPEDTWDVSAAGDGRVMAWVTPTNELYDLYIAAEGGVSAAHDCSDLFAGYSNAKTINFGEAFHTTGATDMSCMFLGCKALTELNLNRFYTSAVHDMSDMFRHCEALTDLTLGDSFDTSAVQDMNSMFSLCSSLTDLTLGDSFVTTNANTTNMFTNCPAGADYQHLLN